MTNNGSQVKIAIDAMGGDNAPFSIVAGTVMGYRVLQDKIKLILVGDAKKIRHELKSLRAEVMPIEVIDAPETIDMNESPAVHFFSEHLHEQQVAFWRNT